MTRAPDLRLFVVVLMFAKSALACASINSAVMK